MVSILGISAFYHDSAAALVVDGEIVAAAQEERFTRVKHDHRFPQKAIDYCLEEARLVPAQLDYVAFYDKPLLKFERLIETYLAYAPVGFRSFILAMPLWLKQKLHLPREIDRGLRGQFKKRYVFTEHHESHAASAFFPSPFEEAAILTIDGVGEWATASYGLGMGNRIDLTHELRFPHSLGLLYSAFTYFAGFKVNSGEYKLMGLAPYGEPRYAEPILDKLIDLKEDGSFRLDMSYFNYCQGLTMTGARFNDLFGGPPRSPEADLTQREMDIAASIQKVTEEIILRTARHVRKEIGMRNLVLSGGVALNCVANGRLLREAGFDDIWIQPAAGDAGGALGTALFVWYQLLNNERVADGAHDKQKGSLLGPSFSSGQYQAYLSKVEAVFHHYEGEGELLDAIVDAMVAEQVVGYFDGRMEFGPRALGCRSIIGDARSREMQTVMNLKIKFRESFRPFAPCILREKVHDWFEMPQNQDSPYMLLVAGVQENRRLELDNEGKRLEGLDRLKHPRSTVPAITHVDCSARIQTVDSERHGRFFRLIERFFARTGCPVIVNTSFNVRGEPIVWRPEDAFRCFMATNMDVLVMGNYLLFKKEQREVDRRDVDRYLTQFELD